MSHQDQNQKKVPVSLIPDIRMLSRDDTWLLMLLIEAARLIDIAYRRQSNQPVTGPFFGLDAAAEFDEKQPKNFYPAAASVETIEAYLREHPNMRSEILSPFTVVVEAPEGLQAIPYSEFYDKELGAIASLLEQASGVAKDEKFRQFLKEKSRAFRTNQYRASDIAWINTSNGPFELTIGPYESYADELFGVKRTFECMLGLVLPDETRMAAGFQESVGTFDAALGERYGYTARTTLTPMVVMDEVYASGESRYEHVPMAYNLPNDLDIHLEVGSKKVFIRNVMRAKFDIMTIPIARKVLQKEMADGFDFDAYLKFVIGHESAHGLSFHFDGERFGPLGAAIEECKADVFGMWFLYFLTEYGFLERKVAETAVMEHLTDCLRQIRFGPEKAHAIGAVVQYNWFIERDALILTEEGLVFNVSQFHGAIMALGDALYALAASREQSALEDFVATWRVVPEQVVEYLTRFADLPVDIDPVFAF